MVGPAPAAVVKVQLHGLPELAEHGAGVVSRPFPATSAAVMAILTVYVVLAVNKPVTSNVSVAFALLHTPIPVAVPAAPQLVT